MALLSYNTFNDFIIHFSPINQILNGSSRKNMNVNIYLFDGLSKYRFSKQMIYTKKYLKKLTKKYKIYEMMKYHTIGFNSALNYRGLIIGKAYDSLFRVFKQYNYSNVVIPGIYDLNLNLYGVNNKKYVDYNIQLFRNCSEPYLYGSGKRCLGNKSRHKHQLDILESIYLYNHNNNISTFSFTTFMESHDSSFISLLRMDKDMANHLDNLHRNNILKESITVLMADHGIHYGNYFNTPV